MLDNGSVLLFHAWYPPLLVIACAVLSTPAVSSHTLKTRLTIVVQDPSGAPIRGAWVQVQHWVVPIHGEARMAMDGAATADGQGQTSFELPPNEYEAVASAVAFTPTIQFVRVPKDQSVSYTLRLSVRHGGGVEVEPAPKSQ